MAGDTLTVLSVDVGSSSLKIASYAMPEERLVAKGNALDGDYGDFDAIGHRLVFGSTRHAEPVLATSAILEELEAYVPMHALHLRPQLDAVYAMQRRYPRLPQVLCFDTAFHRAMPELAKRYPLGPEFDGIERFGYHGLSYEYIVSVAAKRGRAIIAHLGSGASMAAVRDGKSVETTMGFSPLGGLMMGTRPGDLDPGALMHALIEFHYTPERLRDLLTRQSGLAGVSRCSGDVLELLAREARDERARFALDLFAYTARKHVGSLAAVLGGLDLLVFTAGIGEHSPPLRRRICEGLEYLGVYLDAERNERNDETINANGSPVRVAVIPTNEALAIARHTRDVVGRTK